MSKIYLIILVCVITVGAYFYGANLATEKCRARNFENALTEQKQQDQQFNQEQRMINETVYKTGVGDIRRILHDKYTIAQ